MSIRRMKRSKWGNRFVGCAKLESGCECDWNSMKKELDWLIQCLQRAIYGCPEKHWPSMMPRSLVPAPRPPRFGNGTPRASAAFTAKVSRGCLVFDRPTYILERVSDV